MKKKLLICLFLLSFINYSTVYSSSQEDDIETYKQSITRASFVSGAVLVGTWLGENWSVDLTTKIIKKSINSGPLLFNLTIGSSIRGETLIAAIPIAAKKGAIVGAVTTALLAPVIWDCGQSVGTSCKKIWNTIFSENISEKEKAKTKDYVATGVTSIGISLLLYSIFWK